MLFFPSLVCWNGNPQGAQLCGLFDENNKRPCIGTCGHSVCLQCVRANPSLRCPVCRVDDAYAAKTINYQALELIKEYSKNCVTVYDQWWRENPENIGVGCCLKCNFAYETLRICVTCELRAPNIWTRPILKRKTEDPKDPDEFTLDIDVVSAARLQSALRCATCFADDPTHECHKTMRLRDVSDVEKCIKQRSYMIAGKVLEANLACELRKDEHKSCRLRCLRIRRTVESLAQSVQVYFSRLQAPPLLPEDVEKNLERKERAEKLLDSLKVQWGKLAGGQKCECTVLWENNMANRNFESVYQGMSWLELERNEEEKTCPMTFSWNQKFRVSLSIFNGGPKRARPVHEPVTVKQETKEKKVTSPPEFVPYSEYRLLYDHVVELTNIIEKMKKAMLNMAVVLEQDNVELMVEDVPKLAKLSY